MLLLGNKLTGEFNLGYKKALWYNMKAHYKSIGVRIS